MAGIKAFTLLTTRRQNIFAASTVPDRAMPRPTEEQALEMIRAVAGPGVWLDTEQEPNELVVIIRSVRCMPIALAVLGSAIRAEVELRQLRGQLTWSKDHSPDHPFADSFSALDIAMENLSAVGLSQWQRLAVFPSNTSIPHQILAGWLRIQDEELESHLVACAGLGLISRRRGSLSS